MSRPLRDVIPAYETHMSTGLAAFLASSVATRKEWDEQGTYTVRTHHQPTDWDVEDSDKVFWDGLDPNSGTCPVCFLHRSRNGACSIDCPGEQLVPGATGPIRYEMSQDVRKELGL